MWPVYEVSPGCWLLVVRFLTYRLRAPKVGVSRERKRERDRVRDRDGVETGIGVGIQIEI